MEITKLFQMMSKHQSSDLHIKVGQPPVFRVAGQLSRMQNVEPLTPEQAEALLRPLMSEAQLQQFDERGNADFAWYDENIGRFRCNIYHQRGFWSAAIRRVSLDVPTYADLGLPEHVGKCAQFQQGLVLIGGVTGSGKSTSLAAILNDINRNRRCHILTIEDPVEYLFTDDKAIINQREIGIDVCDFQEALRAAVRQDPDVMLVGEMRDAETFETALTAAETGHLVFGTIHSSGAAQTIGRILDLFPEEKHEQVRTSLSFNLKAVLNQKLLKGASKERPRVPAVESMYMTPLIRKCIEDGDDGRIADAIKADTDNGCDTFNQVIIKLYNNKLISADTALKAAPNAEELKMAMRGISISDSGGIA